LKLKWMICYVQCFVGKKIWTARTGRVYQ
jgi:hypothetical protein